MVVEIRRLAHSSVLIRSEEKNIYIDPYRPDSLSGDIDEFYEDPDKADVLLISHKHHDHCDKETFRKMLDEQTTIIAPENCEGEIDQEFVSLNPEENFANDWLKIKSTHAYNIKRKRDSGEPFHQKGDGVGYLITIGGKTIYHPGDTEKIPEMEHLQDVDVAFLPIDGTYTMDIDEAVEAAKIISPKIVIPFHERDAAPKRFKIKLESESDLEVNLLCEGDSLMI